MKRMIKSSRYDEKYELVRECYEEVVADISDSFLDHRRPNTTEIKYDYLSQAAEDWDDLSLDEVEETFDRIYKELEAEGERQAMAWA